MPSGMLSIGHRRRGAGISLDSITELERAIILQRHKSRTVYVDSGLAAAGNGDSWSGGYLTLAAAAAAAVVGDLIFLAPGHSETMIAAAGIAVAKAGVTIVGLGVGRKRATFNYTTSTAASFDITAASVTIDNCVFLPLGIDAIVAPINLSAADCTIANCEFETGNVTNQATIGCVLTTAAADRFSFFNNQVHGSADAGTATCLKIVGGDAAQIVGNTFQGNYTTTLGAIQNVTTACTNTIVTDNIIQNRTASAAQAMTFVSTSTGQISRNYMQILTGTAPIVAAAMSWVGANYYAATIGQLGVLI